MALGGSSRLDGLPVDLDNHLIDLFEQFDYYETCGFVASYHYAFL